MSFDFKQKTYLITGGSSGIGLQCAQHLLQGGASVIICGRDPLKLAAAVKTLGHTQQCSTIAADITLEDDRARLVDALPQLDGVVHSAGVGALVPVRFISEAHFKEVFDINVEASCLLTAALTKKKQLKDGASIVFIASVAGLVSEPGYTVYSASKAALYGMVRGMAVEFARNRIRVNAVSPGHVNTESSQRFAEEMGAELIQSKEALYPLGFGEAEDVANCVGFLLSEGARWVTGTNLVVDGGFSIR